MKTFNGKALFLDRSDINTDEIIPAKYLTEISKQALAPYLLEDLTLDDFDPASDLKEISVIITRENFGCGSSREHAPWALEVNGIHLVIASSYARIFKQNMFNCGMMAIELDPSCIEEIFSLFKNSPATVDTDFEAGTININNGIENCSYNFTISDFNRSLVKAGGWVDFADANY